MIYSSNVIGVFITNIFLLWLVGFGLVCCDYLCCVYFLSEAFFVKEKFLIVLEKGKILLLEVC
jgi:hypothetical protein